LYDIDSTKLRLFYHIFNTMEHGKHLAIVVFASDYKGPRERGEHIIATISKQIWDYYTEK